MKKSYKKMLIFDIVLLIILLLNSFVLNILANNYYLILFLLLLLVVFKLLFGFEKGRYRYVKDILINIVIICFISFILYYILGIFIGFYKTDNYFTWYSIKTFMFPYIVMILLREYLRCQMLVKTDSSFKFEILTCIMFILLELSPRLAMASFSSSYKIFIFLALTVLPIISNNVVCTYIARRLGAKPNILWLLIATLYVYILPIVPNDGQYINALIKFLFPFVLLWNIYSFFEKRKKDVPISYIKKRVYVEIPLLAVLVFVLAYFVSGFFKYYAVAVATGSMLPKIAVGDVVIINQHVSYQDLDVGEVIAYKYDNVIVVHRVVDIVKINDDYYFYTKGDANKDKDNYIIYPDTILGRVNMKIPYIGLPTVWLNDLFK